LWTRTTQGWYGVRKSIVGRLRLSGKDLGVKVVEQIVILAWRELDIGRSEVVAS
jgi:hypothetical protein